MWSCARKRKLLNAYIDSELPERTRREVESHLAECSACRLEHDELRMLMPLLGNYKVPPIPAGLSARILASASLRQKRKEAPTVVGWGWCEFLFHPWLIKGVTTAALVVGLAMGAWMGWTSHRSPDVGQWVAMTTHGNEARTMYAFDVLSAEPRGSIEAATLALLDDGR